MSPGKYVLNFFFFLLFKISIKKYENQSRFSLENMQSLIFQMPSKNQKQEHKDIQIPSASKLILNQGLANLLSEFI